MENNNIIKHNWGYEIIWAKENNYGAKIIVFERPGKTDFIMHSKTQKSWFINNGTFIFNWIDPNNGNFHKKELGEGNVITASIMAPYSLECTSKYGSLAEVNNGYTENDDYIILKGEILNEISL